MLERELEKLLGANWQVRLYAVERQIPTDASVQANLDLVPTSAIAARAATGFMQRSIPTPPPDSRSSSGSQPAANVEASMAHVEQVRLLVLGMEQRLQSREEKLRKTISLAQAEGSRFEDMRQQVLSSS